MAFLKIVAVVGGLSVLDINHSANALLLCLYPCSYLSVIFCIMCVYYILHAHLLINNEILEIFTWKTNVLSVSPLLYPSFPIFSCVLLFHIWDPCIYINVHTMEACNKDYYHYYKCVVTCIAYFISHLIQCWWLFRQNKRLLICRNQADREM